MDQPGPTTNMYHMHKVCGNVLPIANRIDNKEHSSFAIVRFHLTHLLQTYDICSFLYEYGEAPLVVIALLHLFFPNEDRDDHDSPDTSILHPAKGDDPYWPDVAPRPMLFHQRTALPDIDQAPLKFRTFLRMPRPACQNQDIPILSVQYLVL